MSEALSADVSIATQEAYQNLMALMGAITSAESQLDKMGEAVKSADGRIGGLTKALNDAETQFKSTGAEADRVKMEELRTALDSAKQRAGTLRTEFGNLEMQLRNVATQQGKTAAEAVRDGKQMVDSSRATGDAAKDAGEKAADAQDKTKKKTKESEDAFKGLSDAMIGVGASLFSLQKAVEIVKELEEHTKAVVAERIKLGEIKVGVDEKIQAVIDNLGFLPGAAGQDRARKLVQAVQSRAPGTTAEVGAELLAKAQATGYKVADASRPDLDTKAPAFDIAIEVAKFSARQRLDADTAGKLFNMAQIAGVKTRSDMERMLSQMEMAFNEIAITNPREGMRAAITASAGRMVQGVPINQALAGVAAAAVGEPDPSKAATNVDQFTRVAAGASPQHAQFLANLARQRGLLSPEAMAQAAAEVKPTIKGDNVREIAQARTAIERDRSELERSQRERGDRATEYAEQEQRFSFEVAQLAKDAADPKKRKQLPEIEERERRARTDWAKYQREATEKLRDADAKDKETQGRIAGTESRIAEMQAVDTKKLTDAATLRAFQSLPLAQRENLIWEVTRGMNASQLGVFSTQAAEGDVAQQLVKMLGPAARAARERALAAGATPDVAALRQRNAAFGTNTLAQKSAAEIAAEQAATAAMAPGSEFFNNANTLATRDIEILKSKGQGRTGFLASMGEGVFINQTANAGTDDMIRARRLYLIVRDQFSRFLQTSDKQTYGRYNGRITALWQKLEMFRTGAFQAEASTNAGADRLKEIQEIATSIGALTADMQRSALENNETPGLSGAGGLDLPANRAGFGFDQPTFTPEQLGTGSTGAPAPAAGTSAGGSGVGNAAGGPRASAAGATYNINVSTLVSQGADSFDLPARLGVPDLG